MATQGLPPNSTDDPVLEPDLPIVDPHHHLIGEPPHPYLLPDLLANVNSGHKIVATVAVECNTMYRADGPAALRPVGEVEFFNGVAAMSASGNYGPCRVADAIVGHADLSLGAEVGPVLEALARAGDGRLRGVRDIFAWDSHKLFAQPLDPARKGMMNSSKFREGLARLAPLGMSFDGWCWHPQLPEFARLVDAFPTTTFILNHLGTPLGVGFYAGKRGEILTRWRADMRELGKRPNVVVKLGGLGMSILGSPLFGRKPQASVAEIAADWRPYIETGIEAFGPDRGMFESNFPPDRDTCDYRTIWNVFKTLTAGYSPSEKAALFHDTAKRIYRMNDQI
jgi:predicted TIM-barrel fold metal-dependent hydrolase